MGLGLGFGTDLGLGWDWDLGFGMGWDFEWVASIIMYVSINKNLPIKFSNFKNIRSAAVVSCLPMKNLAV